MRNREQVRYEVVEVPFGGIAIWDCKRNSPAEIDDDHLSGLSADLVQAALQSLSRSRSLPNRADGPVVAW